LIHFLCTHPSCSIIFNLSIILKYLSFHNVFRNSMHVHDLHKIRQIIHIRSSKLKKNVSKLLYLWLNYLGIALISMASKKLSNISQTSCMCYIILGCLVQDVSLTLFTIRSESTNILRSLLPIFFSISNMKIRASYSATLLVHSNSNLKPYGWFLSFRGYLHYFLVY
jgi:hypothetical protein